MKNYSEIKLDENQKEFLQMLLDSGYTILTHEDMYGLIATGITDFDENKTILLSGIVEPNTFNWVKDYESCEIDKLLNPTHDSKTVWDLNGGDVCWLITSRGLIYKIQWDPKSGYFDVDCRNQGNVFLTEEEAEFEAKRRQITTILKKYARPFIAGKENYCIAFSKEENSIDFPWQDDYQYNDLYFDDEVAIGEAIEEVGDGDYNKGEELVIKYYLGVTE